MPSPPFVHISTISQRYADSKELQFEIPIPDLRSQDTKNRQNSIDDINPRDKAYMEAMIAEHFKQSLEVYNALLDKGVAKECARFVLPQNTQTRLYMSGNVRSWLHYLELRTANGTQKEHMELAEDIRAIFIEQFPIISEALEWK